MKLFWFKLAIITICFTSILTSESLEFRKVKKPTSEENKSSSSNLNLNLDLDDNVSLSIGYNSSDKTSKTSSKDTIHSSTTKQLNQVVASSGNCCKCTKENNYRTKDPKAIKGFNYFQKKNVFNECYRYFDMTISEEKTSLLMDSDYSKILGETSTSVEGGLMFLGNGVKMKFQSDFKENSTSYYFYLHFKTSRVYKYNYLLGTGKNEDLVLKSYVDLIKKPNEFLQICGNYLKKTEEVGISVIAQIQINFSSYASKKLFKTKIKVTNIDTASIQTEIETALMKIDSKATVSVKTMQYGGDAEELLRVIDPCNIVKIGDKTASNTVEKIVYYVNKYIPEQTRRLKDNAIVISTSYIDSQIKLDYVFHENEKFDLTYYTKLADYSNSILEKTNYYLLNLENILTTHKEYYYQLNESFKGMITYYYFSLVRQKKAFKKQEDELCLGNLEKCNKNDHDKVIAEYSLNDTFFAEIDKFFLNIKNLIIYDLNLDNWKQLKNIQIMIQVIGNKSNSIDKYPNNFIYSLTLLKSDYTLEKDGNYYYFEPISVSSPFDFAFKFYHRFNIFPRYQGVKNNEVCINWYKNRSTDWCGIDGYPAYTPRIEINPVYFYPYGSTIKDRKKRKQESKTELNNLPKTITPKDEHETYVEENPFNENIIKGYNSIQKKEVNFKCFKYLSSELKEPRIQTVFYTSLDTLVNSLGVDVSVGVSYAIAAIEASLRTNFKEDSTHKYFYFKLTYSRLKNYTYENGISLESIIAKKYIELFTKDTENHNTFVESCGNSLPIAEKLGLFVYIQIKMESTNITTEISSKIGVKLDALTDAVDIGAALKAALKLENLDNKFSYKIVIKGNANPVLIDSFECSNPMQTTSSKSLKEFITKDLAEEIKKPTSMNVISVEYNEDLPFKVEFNNNYTIDVLNKAVYKLEKLKKKSEYYLDKLSNLLSADSNLKDNYHEYYSKFIKELYMCHQTTISRINDKSNSDNLCKGTFKNCNPDKIYEFLKENKCKEEEYIRTFNSNKFMKNQLSYFVDGFVKFAFKVTPFSIDPIKKEYKYYLEEIVSLRKTDYKFKSYIVVSNNPNVIPITIANNAYEIRYLEKRTEEDGYMCFTFKEDPDGSSCEYYRPVYVKNPYFFNFYKYSQLNHSEKSNSFFEKKKRSDSILKDLLNSNNSDKKGSTKKYFKRKSQDK